MKKNNEFLLEANTNKRHIINAIKATDDLLVMISLDPTIDIDKKIPYKYIKRLDVAGGGLYRFVINRVPGKDIDIFMDNFEGLVFTIESVYYQGYPIKDYLIAYRRSLTAVYKLMYIHNVLSDKKRKGYRMFYRHIYEIIDGVINNDDVYSNAVSYQLLQHQYLDFLERLTDQYRKDPYVKVVYDYVKEAQDHMDKMFREDISYGSYMWQYSSAFDENMKLIVTEDIIKMNRLLTQLRDSIMPLDCRITNLRYNW